MRQKPSFDASSEFIKEARGSLLICHSTLINVVTRSSVDQEATPPSLLSSFQVFRGVSSHSPVGWKGNYPPDRLCAMSGQRRMISGAC